MLHQLQASGNKMPISGNRRSWVRREWWRRRLRAKRCCSWKFPLWIWACDGSQCFTLPWVPLELRLPWFVSSPGGFPLEDWIIVFLVIAFK